jgi:heat shock protein HslJ
MIPVMSARARQRSLVLAGLALLAVASVALAASDRGELFPRPWDSTAVKRAGITHPLFDRTAVSVDFERHGETVGWKAECNSFGTQADIRKHRLVIDRQIVGTEIACPDLQARQDGWLVRFFASSPKWRILDSGLLKLTAGHRVIELQRRPRGN